LETDNTLTLQQTL
jgi:hypothetical protein